jgi:chromosome segregation ATPase
MPRAGVTFEEVAAAVAELESRGDRATQLAVRHALGDRGSMNTIRDHLKTLREQRAADRRESRDMPPEMMGAIQDSAASLWKRAQELATRDVEAIRSATQARVDMAEQESEDLAAAYDEQTEQLRQSRLALEDTQKRLEEAEQARVTAQAEKAEIEKLNSALLTRLDSQAEAIERLTAQLSKNLQRDEPRRPARSKRRT